MEAKLRVLEHFKSNIEKARSNFKKSPKERLTLTYVETRLESLESTFTLFGTKHEELLSSFESKELNASKYISDDVFQDVTDLYIEYKVELKNVLSKLQGVPQRGSASQLGNVSEKGSNIKLPKITIPMFSGKYTEWSTFRDLFVSLVHSNASLDDVQKLHYLKTQLSGEAEQLVKHVPITQAKYMQCWNLLEKRYNNKRFLANCILKRLFSQRNITNESSSALKDLLDTTSDCLHEISNLGIDIKSWDIIVIYIASSKLDAESRKQWELQVSESSEDLPRFADFTKFLETRFRALESIEPRNRATHSYYKPPVNAIVPKVLHATSSVSCPVCSENHKLGSCKRFIKENTEHRRSMVQSMGLCFNCLAGNHSVKYCRVSTKCQICHRKHHSLLHPKIVNAEVEVATGINSNSAAVVPTSVVAQNENETSNISAHFTSGNANQVLLATAIVKADSINGVPMLLRSLLDQGSQASFISEAAVQLLQLKKDRSKSLISGIGGDSGGLTSKSVVMVNIQSLYDPTFTLQVKAHVLRTLTSILPERNLQFTFADWPHLQEISLADPNFNTPNKIDILLGAEVYGHIIQEGLIKGPPGSPLAQNTCLGWILSGKVGKNEKTPRNSIVSMHINVDEDNQLKKFWEMESEGSVQKILTLEEQACEEHFIKNTRRDADGRYIVSLPFKDIDPLCKYGNSKAIAMKRFIALERKLSNNSQLKQRYFEVINEYLQMGHMEMVKEDERNKPDAVYLPHHAVIREDKTTTKTRVVFDASCKGTNGVSLNDTLMVGPALQADLRHIVMKWRKHPICLAADIIKMYRMVKVTEDHTDFQRIVWRENIHSEVQEYRLLRVTFGTSSAPYLAVKALQQTAYDEGHSFPLAAERVLKDFYMDDVMTGCQTEEEAVEVYEQLNGLLRKGGFELQKWTSNKERLLENTGRDVEIRTEDRVTKVLGLTWNRNTDEFFYTVQLTLTTRPVTKRKVISEISRLYDPLGWIAPCIITSKVFIQKLWRAGLEWDEELPPQLLDEWETYRKELSRLDNFHIPRWLHTTTHDVLVELHGFSDASNVAFAAAVYIRVVDSKGQIHSSLVTAKTKVAPIKQLSIPRLELCGAVLLTKIMIEVADVLEIDKSNLHAWTDSTVVLAWLKDHPSRWKTFVANRTAEILDSIEYSQWSHVQSEDNPADCASRGLMPRELLMDRLWKEGPLWLKSEAIPYSKSHHEITELEKKSFRTHHSIALDDKEEFITKFSTLRKLFRVIAYCRRLLPSKRSGVNCKPTYLLASEVRDALDSCIRRTQLQWFARELKDLSDSRSVSKKSTISSLNPFLDEKGVLRVGGRLQQAKGLESHNKHPIIIHQDSHLAKLIVADSHEKTLHGGPQLMLNYVRLRYWILRAKNLIKTCCHNCVTCIRHSAVPQHQLMGQLPSCRVTPSKPFLKSGVDYAGPINIRFSKGRGQHSYKGYICLFVCMATRAVHIEAVSDYTSQGFLAAFKRFVARRGHCSDVWSDNGTNFVGASRELKILFSNENLSMATEIASVLANNGTEWHFIPPYAPNFGGLWEAGIKSTKHHLKRVIGDSTLTFEELTTVLSQIEACLNSRPLSRASMDPNDLTPLTPGHFLVGEPLILPPEHNFEHENISSLRRWQLTQRMVQNFWRRWSQEYLTQFFHRYKWAKKLPEPKTGDIVIVRENNLPPARWLLGKIIQLHPGKDNIIRVVTLRSNGSEMKRPLSKLCLLPMIN